MSGEGIAWLLLLAAPALVIFAVLWRLLAEARWGLLAGLLGVLGFLVGNELLPSASKANIRFAALAALLLAGGCLYFWLRIAPRLVIDGHGDEATKLEAGIRRPSAGEAGVPPDGAMDPAQRPGSGAANGVGSPPPAP